MKWAAGTLLAVALLLAGCADPEPAKPVFRQGDAPKTGSAALAKAKKAAGIDDCPAVGTKSGDLPALTLDCLGGGRPVQLDAIGGTPTVINLWASWCKPCREELPLFAKAHGELSDRLQILGIDFDDDAPAAAIDLARRSGVTYPLLADPNGDVTTSLKVVGLPQTVFVDAQGTIVATERRAYDSYEDLTRAIETHLGVTP